MLPYFILMTAFETSFQRWKLRILSEVPPSYSLTCSNSQATVLPRDYCVEFEHKPYFYLNGRYEHSLQTSFCLKLTFIVLTINAVRGFFRGDKTFPSRTHFSEFSWFQKRQGKKKLGKRKKKHLPWLFFSPWVCFQFSFAFSNSVT